MFGAEMHNNDVRLFDKALNFFVEVLELKRWGYDIKIHRVPKMDGTIQGHCGPRWTKDSTHADLKMSHIEIVIRESATVFGMIEALAHEMVHARQFLQGDFVFTWERYFYLKVFPRIKHVKTWKGRDVTNFNYHDCPAEQEAFSLQKALTYAFLKTVESEFQPGTVSLPQIKGATVE